MDHGGKNGTDECKRQKSMKRFRLNIIDKDFEIDIEKRKKGLYYVMVNGVRYEATVEEDTGKSTLFAVDGGLYNVELEGEIEKGKMRIRVNERERVIDSRNLLGAQEIAFAKKPIPVASKVDTFAKEEPKPPSPGITAQGISAPMPGKVVAIMKKVGDDVKVGDVVLILEAMKMENEITSNMEGKITEVRIKEGDNVDANDVMVVIG
jgi:biotin carboxyl carrier protein